MTIENKLPESAQRAITTLDALAEHTQFLAKQLAEELIIPQGNVQRVLDQRDSNDGREL
ncbi:MAG TPA: hypothetical protein VI861_02990 [Rickettsiales bacterium]|nr:hypothetical protein [Rickettsiales bacterium]